jgi:hypothetical protein
MIFLKQTNAEHDGMASSNTETRLCVYHAVIQEQAVMVHGYRRESLSLQKIGQKHRLLI